MRCLEAGGIDVVVDKDVDEELNSWFGSDGYAPNPNGFYQAPADLFEDENIVEKLQGKVVKVYLENVKQLPVASYKVIFMRRAKEEILASMDKMSNGKHWGDEQTNVENGTAFVSLEKYRLSKRKDIEILNVDYSKVVSNPQEAFTKIKDFGFPIDVEKASSMVEPSLHRFKLENL